MAASKESPVTATQPDASRFSDPACGLYVRDASEEYVSHRKQYGEMARLDAGVFFG